MPRVIFSYDQTLTAHDNLDDNQTKTGNTFTPNATSTLYSVKVSIQKSGSPTGNATIKIFAITGTHGVDGKPTGSALATSDNVDVSSLPTSYTFIEFLFSGINKITLSAGTYYCAELNYADGTSSNKINVSMSSTSKPSDENKFDNFGGPYEVDTVSFVNMYIYNTINDFTKSLSDTILNGASRSSALTRGIFNYTKSLSDNIINGASRIVTVFKLRMIIRSFSDSIMNSKSRFVTFITNFYIKRVKQSIGTWTKRQKPL